MKRRTFISTLAALAATPALPTTILAAPSTAATQHFALAKLLARAHNHCTRDMLARHLKVSPEIARQVQTLLLERGVITPPVAGISMATNPMNTNCVPKEALKPTNIAQQAADVRGKVKQLMEKHAEKLPPPEVELQNPEQPEAEFIEIDDQTDAPESNQNDTRDL